MSAVHHSPLPYVEETDEMDHHNNHNHISSHSLPTAEEVRTEASMINKGPSSYEQQRARRRFLWVAGCTLALTLIVGLSVGVALNNKKSNNRKEVHFNANATIEAEDPSNFVTRSESRLDDVLDFLSERVSKRIDLDNTSSPQYKAALWIADQDAALFDLPDDPTSYDDSYWFVQRYILAVLYYSLDGKNWRYKSGFMTDADVCDWNFYVSAESAPVGADQTDWTYGVQCNDDGAVDTIFMSHNNMSGELPGEIGDLLDLYHMSFFDNRISGSLPTKMSYLVDLEFLAIESNELSGPLPDWLNQLVGLEYLALGDNDLTGKIPDLQGLDDLEEIALDYNQLTGGIDQLNKCPSLVNVYLNDNKLTDRFHEVTFKDLDNLEVLEIGDNMLTGYVPSWIYGNRVADLHDNFLNETVLREVEDFDDDSPLEFLSLYGNNIWGSIPDSLSLLTNVQHLDLSDNLFTGTIPEIFDDMEMLTNLYLTNNFFLESEFPYVRTCRNLKELGAADANLVGVLPHYVGELPNLVLLDVRDNDLRGTLPESIGQLRYLQYLLLNRNLFTGTVPQSWENLESLVSLYLDNNDLKGSVDHICETEPQYLSYFSADCHEEKGTVACDCCDICCHSGDETCNDWDDSLRLSDAADRDAYLFSEDVTFAKDQKEVRKLK